MGNNETSVMFWLLVFSIAFSDEMEKKFLSYEKLINMGYEHDYIAGYVRNARAIVLSINQDIQ